MDGLPGGKRPEQAEWQRAVSAAVISVSITLGIVALGTTVGFLAGARRKMDWNNGQLAAAALARY